jgi:hypothetical protein
MKTKITLRKRRTLISLLATVGLLVTLIFIAGCYEFTTVGQPVAGYTNSSFQVPIVLKPNDPNFNNELHDYGLFGVLLPIGWTIDDNIAFNVKGTYVTFDPLKPFSTDGILIHSDVYSKMYEDSVGSPAGYYWWGGKSNAKYYVDNLDSISLTVTIHTDNQVGNFELQYAIGTLDYWERYPVADISNKIPISISLGTGISAYLEKQISVNLNSSSKILTVDMGDVKNANIQIFDLTGRLTKETKSASGVKTLNLNDLRPGSYIISVKTSNGKVTKKIVLER